VVIHDLFLLFMVVNIAEMANAATFDPILTLPSRMLV